MTLPVTSKLQYEVLLSIRLFRWWRMGGGGGGGGPPPPTVVWWLVRWTQDRTVRVRLLAVHCVLLLGKTLYSHSASVHPGV